jgi:hypothetical protein
MKRKILRNTSIFLLAIILVFSPIGDYQHAKAQASDYGLTTKAMGYILGLAIAVKSGAEYVTKTSLYDLGYFTKLILKDMTQSVKDKLNAKTDNAITVQEVNDWGVNEVLNTIGDEMVSTQEYERSELNFPSALTGFYNVSKQKLITNGVKFSLEYTSRIRYVSGTQIMNFSGMGSPRTTTLTKFTYYKNNVPHTIYGFSIWTSDEVKTFYQNEQIYYYAKYMPEDEQFYMQNIFSSSLMATSTNTSTMNTYDLPDGITNTDIVNIFSAQGDGEVFNYSATSTGTVKTNGITIPSTITIPTGTLTEDAVKSLNPSIGTSDGVVIKPTEGTIPDEGTGEQTGLLSNILSEIKAIPQKLNTMLETVRDIPRAVTQPIIDWFSVDWTQVKLHMNYVPIFQVHFKPFYDITALLSNIQANPQTGNGKFYMKIPHEMGGDDQEHVVLDLSVGDVYITTGRTILMYGMWIGFLWYLLKLFSPKLKM